MRHTIRYFCDFRTIRQIFSDISVKFVVFLTNLRILGETRQLRTAAFGAPPQPDAHTIRDRPGSFAPGGAVLIPGNAAPPTPVPAPETPHNND
jgi:hypothetical protein